MDIEDKQADRDVRRALSACRWSNICRMFASVPLVPTRVRYRAFMRATLFDREAAEAVDRLGPDSIIRFDLRQRGRFGARARIVEK